MSRSGEELALNDRYLNPQIGRVLRTLGFDRTWSGGEGAHLVDSAGERYLDLFGGYGVFAIGRGHPEAIAALEQVMAARTANMPQLGATLLSGVLAEALVARAPAQRRGDGRPPTAAPRRSSARSSSRARRPAARGCCTRSTPSTGSRSGSLSLNGNSEFRERLRPAARATARRSRSAISPRSSARSPPATWPRSWSSPCRARA